MNIRYGYNPLNPDSNGPIYWNNPQNWVRAGVQIAYRIVGNTNFTDYLVNNYIQKGQLTALGGTGSDLNRPTSPIKNQINYLITNRGLSGLGVGIDTTNPTGGQSADNPTIQYNPRPIDRDELFVDLNATSGLATIGVSLFYSQETVPWKTTPTVERLEYRLLREVPINGDFTINDRHYDFVSPYRIQPATQTGSWVDTNDFANLNPGQDEFVVSTGDQPFDAILFRGADYAHPAPVTYTEPITHTSDYILSYIETEEAVLIDDPPYNCFEWTNYISSAELAYGILNNGTTLTAVDPYNSNHLAIVNPIQDNTDLGAITNLPPEVTGIGVDVAQPTPLVGNNPETRANSSSQIQKGDVLEIDFDAPSYSARIALSLFYANQPIDGQRRPEQMRYRLYNNDTPVGEEVTVTARGTGNYAGGNPGNPGNIIFGISSQSPFDTIRFMGADYGPNANGDYLAPPQPTDYSDYLVRGVCTGNIGQTGESSVYPSGPFFYYITATEPRDYILDFNQANNAIVINKSGFGLDQIAGFNAIQGTTPIGSSPVRNYFRYNTTNGNLCFDADGIGGNPANILTTLVGAPNLDSLFFVS